MVSSIDPSGLGAITSGAVLQTLINNQNAVLANLAQSGFQGVLSSLTATGAVQQTYSALQETYADVQQAAALAAKDPFVPASSALQNSTETAVTQGLVTQQNNEFSSISQAGTAATQAEAGTQAKTPEAAAAAQVVTANNELVAVENAIKAGHLQTVVSDTQTAITDAQNAEAAAQTAYDNAPSAEKAAALAVLNAAKQNLTAAQGLLPVAQHAAITTGQATPQVYDLGNGYSATTWGNTGYWTLVDPTGKGILVAADGTVTNLDGSNTWQFQTTSTFLLPDDTKITVIPGSSGATVEFVRGKHHVEFDNLGNGTPTVVGPDENGRAVDQAQNDGYIFDQGSDASTWTLNGFTIANGSTVATQPLTNELKVDPTAISISPDLAAYLASQGLTPDSYAGNGKYNDTELLASALGVVQTAQNFSKNFNSIVQASVLANSAMADLVTFLQKLQVNQGKTDQQRFQQQLNNQVIEQEIVGNVQQRLNSAQRILQTNSASLSAAASQQGSPATSIVLNASLPQTSNQNANPNSGVNSTGTPTTSLSTGLGQNRATRLLGNVPSQILETVTSALNQPTRPASNENSISQVSGPEGNVLSVPNLPANIPSTPTGFESASQALGETKPDVTVSQVNPFTVGGQTVVNPLTSPASNENLTSQVIGPGGNVLSVPNLPANIPSTAVGFESASQPLGQTKPNVTVSQINPFTVGAQTVVNPLISPASNEEVSSQVVGPGGNVISVPNLPGNIPSISTGFASASQLPGETRPNVPPLIPVNPNAVGQLTPTSTQPLAPITTQPVAPTIGQPNVPFPTTTGPVIGSELHSQRIFSPDTETPDDLPSAHNLVRGKTNPNPLQNLQTQAANSSDAELVQVSRQIETILHDHSEQMAQADAIFTSARDTVKAFLQTVDQDASLKKAIYASDQSKAQQDALAKTMADLRQQLGLSGGSYVSLGADPTNLDSADKSQLLNKLMNAGLTI